MKEQIKAPKIELSDEGIANPAEEFKTLVIRMLTEMVEYARKIEEEVKAMKSEIKENIQGANSDRKETGTQINDLEQKEERNIQQEHNEETRIQKNGERSLLGLLAKIKCSICSYQFKKWGETSEPPGQLKTFQHLNHRGARRRRGRERNGKLI